MRHVGRGDRWSAQIVAGQSADYVDPRIGCGRRPPTGRDNEIAWLQDGIRELLDAVDQSGNRPRCGRSGPRPAHWWIRRRLHETPSTPCRRRARVGCRLRRRPGRRRRRNHRVPERVVVRSREWATANTDRPLGAGQSLHLHATDTAGEGPSSAARTGSSSTAGTTRRPRPCGVGPVSFCWRWSVAAAPTISA